MAIVDMAWNEWSEQMQKQMTPLAWRAASGVAQLAFAAGRKAEFLRQVPDVLVKANDEIGNCPLRSPARSIAIRQFQALAGEYVRRLIDEANPAQPTSGDDSPRDVSWWVRRLKDQEAITDRLAARVAELEATPAQAGAYPEGSDREVLNYLMQQFDTEVHFCERCGMDDPTKDCDSAIYLREYLAKHPAQAGAELPERTRNEAFNLADTVGEHMQCGREKEARVAIMEAFAARLGGLDG